MAGHDIHRQLLAAVSKNSGAGQSTAVEFCIKEKSVAVATAAAVAAATFGQFFRVGNAPQFDCFGDVLLDEVLEIVHFFLRVEVGDGDRVFKKGIAILFKSGDFRRFQRLAALLFFLKGLALGHQGFILAARASVSQKGVNPFADAAGFEVFSDDFAKLLGFLFNFGGHIL